VREEAQGIRCAVRRLHFVAINIMNEKNPISPIQDSWGNPEHVRLRIHPRFTDQDFFHFADLNAFIQQNASSEKITLLDYGAGSSPYRVYFPQADYRRADVIEMPGLRYAIRPDSTVPEADETFDLILSTQVTAHVGNPEVYFRECFRLLKPGGKLLLTTHGIWEEHGVPYDFQRWTEQGMRRDLMAAGFLRPDIYKLTCGFRALMFLFTRTYFSITPPKSRMPRFLFKGLRFVYSRLFPMIYRACDRYWPGEKIVKADDGLPTAPFYIVIAALAEKK
jgi:SAM-dependent methyltransferase